MSDCCRRFAALLLMAVLVGCGTTTEPATSDEQRPAETTLRVTVRPIEPMTIASISRVGAPDGVGPALAELAGWAAKVGVSPGGAPFGVFHSGPDVPAEQMQYEVCLPVPDGTPSDSAAGVTVKPFGGMQCAATEFTGAYTGIGPVYGQLQTWIAGSAYEVAGPALEFYLSDPQLVPPESLKTEVAFVVKPKPQ